MSVIELLTSNQVSAPVYPQQTNDTRIHVPPANDGANDASPTSVQGVTKFDHLKNHSVSKLTKWKKRASCLSAVTLVLVVIVIILRLTFLTRYCVGTICKPVLKW